MFLISLWSNLTKKDTVESAKYEITKFSTCTYSFRRFFSWIRIFGRSGLRKKSSIQIQKKTRIRNTEYRRGRMVARLEEVPQYRYCSHVRRATTMCGEKAAYWRIRIIHFGEWSGSSSLKVYRFYRQKYFKDDIMMTYLDIDFVKRIIFQIKNF